VAGGTDAHKASIDHYSDFVAEGLSFVHAVSGQHNRRVLQVLEHFEETATGNRVHTGSRLVQEFHGWVGQEGNRATQLALVTSTKIASLLISELSKVQSLLDKLSLEFYILGAQTFNSTDHIHVLIHC
jgi:hypothetical protein